MDTSSGLPLLECFLLEFSGLHCCLFVKVHFYQAIKGDCQRRRRDLNPRTAINDLLPFQGSPFSLLGTSPNKADFIKNIIKMFDGEGISSGEGGIRTHAPLRTNGFQDRLVMTTSIPLHIVRRAFSARIILANTEYIVNNFFRFFGIFVADTFMSVRLNCYKPFIQVSGS